MSATISLIGPSTSPGAPQITPAALDDAVNAALLGNYQAALASLAVETARAQAAEAALAGLSASLAYIAANLGATLPTTLPATSGVMWLNGGVFQQS
jgi:hypothetical protein